MMTFISATGDLGKEGHFITVFQHMRGIGIFHIDGDQNIAGHGIAGEMLRP